MGASNLGRKPTITVTDFHDFTEFLQTRTLKQKNTLSFLVRLSLFLINYPIIRCHWLDTSVGIVTGYKLDNRWPDFESRGERFFCSSRRPDRFWGPASFLSNGYWGFFFFPGVKRPEYQADYSSHTSAEVKNTWIYISIFPYAFIASASLVKHSDCFSFSLIVQFHLVWVIKESLYRL
jgi:hypothetical protein